MIGCGSCKGKHDTVAEVRGCYGFPGSVAVKERPRPAEPKFNTNKLEDGFYWIEGRVFKVITAKLGSQRKYAKLLEEDGSWSYAKGVVSRLRPEHFMTREMALEAAKKFGLNPDSPLYGRCFKCKSPLTDEVSIAEGLGPICGGR